MKLQCPYCGKADYTLLKIETWNTGELSPFNAARYFNCKNCFKDFRTIDKVVAITVQTQLQVLDESGNYLAV